MEITLKLYKMGFNDMHVNLVRINGKYMESDMYLVRK